jgi:hypothetical protein
MNPRQRLLDQLVVKPGQAAGIARRDPGWTGDVFPDLSAGELEQRSKDANPGEIAGGSIVSSRFRMRA